MKNLYTLIIILFLSISAFAQESLTRFNDLYLQDISISELPANSKLSDFGPSLINGNLYLTSNNESKSLEQKYKNQVFYDLFSVNIDEEGKVTSTRRLLSELVSEFHVGPSAYNKATEELFFTRSNADDPKITPFKPFQTKKLNLELIIAKKIGDKWSIVKEFEHNNKEYSVGHPAFTPSGDTLIFVSDMPGGFGGTDLYMSTRLEDGWSLPKNMGSRINTPGKEFTPFVTVDGILIFASDGLEENTGLNLYFTEISDANDASIVKFPAPINGTTDDFGMVISDNHRFGYFTSDRPGTGSDDIYRIDFGLNMLALEGKVINAFTKNPIDNALVTFAPPVVIPKNVYSDNNGDFKVEVPSGELDEISGSKDGFKPATIKYNNEPKVIIELMPEVMLELSVRDAETKDYLTDVNINFNDEEEFLSGPTGKTTRPIDGNTIYYIRGTHPEYLDNSLSIGAEGEPGLIKATLWMYKGMVGKTFVLENIYYDFDKWDILPQSAVELDKVVRIMNENPGLKVELGSHTDSRGTDQYNVWLAQKRSNSAVAYITSKGISSNMIVAQGYGENQPYIAAPKNEVEHRLNRRTTFTIKEMNSSKPMVTSVPSDQSAYGKTSVATSQTLTPKTKVKDIASEYNIQEPMATGTNYRVQFYASVKPVNINSRMKEVVEKFSKYGIINQPEDNILKYQIGPLSSKSEGIEVFDSLVELGYQVMLLEYNGNKKVKMLLP